MDAAHHPRYLQDVAFPAAARLPGLWPVLFALACQNAPAAPRVAASTAPSADPKPAVRIPTVTRLEPVEVSPPPHPLQHLTVRELTDRVKKDAHRLGAVSIGRPNRGGLFNGVQMPEGPYWEVRDPDRSWAAQETIDSLIEAISSVAREFPRSPKLVVGDMSKPKGGYFRPHRSHQSGRDADVGYYYVHGQDWYERANQENLDVARTWALVKALISRGNVEYIFIDHSVQDLLKQHATKNEPASEWLDDVFETPDRKTQPIIRHTRGHSTHLHVRFYCEQARETARRTHRLLARFGKI